MPAVLDSHARRPGAVTHKSPRSGFFTPAACPPTAKGGTSARHERHADPKSKNGSSECLSRIPRSPRCTAALSPRRQGPSYIFGSTTPRPTIPPHCSMRSAHTPGSTGSLDTNSTMGCQKTRRPENPPSPCAASVDVFIGCPVDTTSETETSEGGIDTNARHPTAVTQSPDNRPTQHWFLTSGNFSEALEAAQASAVTGNGVPLNDDATADSNNESESWVGTDIISVNFADQNPEAVMSDSNDEELVIICDEPSVTKHGSNADEESHSKTLLGRTRGLVYEMMYRHQRRKAEKEGQRVAELKHETVSLRQKVADLRASRTEAMGTIRNQRAQLSTESACVAMWKSKAEEVPSLKAALEAARKDAEEQRAERKADMSAMQAADKALSSARRRILELEEQNATLTEQVVEQAGRLAGAHKRSTSVVQELQEAKAASMKLEMELREMKAVEQEIKAAWEANEQKDEELTRERGKVAVLSAQYTALRASIARRSASEPPTWEILKEGELGMKPSKMHLKPFSAKPKRREAPGGNESTTALRRSSPFAQGTIVRFSTKTTEAAVAH